MRNIPNTFKEKKNLLSDDDFIYLYEIYLPNSSVLYFAAYNTDVTFNNQTYTAFPIIHSEFKEDSFKPGSMSVTVANVDRTIQSYLEQYKGLIGRKVVVKIVHPDYLNDPNSVVSLVLYISECTYTPTIITFTLEQQFDLFNVTIPARKFIRHRCSWVYKGYGCWLGTSPPYTQPSNFRDVTGSCSKILGTNDQSSNGCNYHFNGKPERFGGFPGIPSGRIIVR